MIWFQKSDFATGENITVSTSKISFEGVNLSTQVISAMKTSQMRNQNWFEALKEKEIISIFPIISITGTGGVKILE